MKIRVIQAFSLKDFNTLCSEAAAEGFMFVGQLVVTGLGKDKSGESQFMYTQQWAAGVDLDSKEDADA